MEQAAGVKASFAEALKKPPAPAEFAEEVILQRAASYGADLANAKSPADVNSILAQLHKLTSSSTARNSSTVMQAINNFIVLATQQLETIATEKNKEQQDHDAALVASHPIDAHKEPMAHIASRFMSEKQRKAFEAIDPKADVKAEKLDEKGKPTGEEIVVKGAQVRDATALIKTYANQDNLDSEEKKNLNKALHGHEHNSNSKEDREKDDKTIKDAICLTGGVAAQKVGQGARRDEILTHTQTTINDLDKVRELEKTKETLPPALQASGNEVLKQQREKLNTDLEADIDDLLTPKSASGAVEKVQAMPPRAPQPGRSGR